MAITVLLSFTACNAQIKNAKTESVKIYGNCGMCETTIEKDRKSTRLNSSHVKRSRMPSSA